MSETDFSCLFGYRCRHLCCLFYRRHRGPSLLNAYYSNYKDSTDSAFTFYLYDLCWTYCDFGCEHRC